MSAEPLLSDGADSSNRRNSWRPRFNGRFFARRAGEREALVLAFICFLDMYTTLFWVMFGVAEESNKLLAWTFDSHPLTFVVVKSATVLPAVILAPRLAEKRKNFTVWLLRGIIVLYIVLYFKMARF